MSTRAIGAVVGAGKSTVADDLSGVRFRTPEQSGFTGPNEPIPSGESMDFICECGESFDTEVWHCPGDAHHWALGDDECRNCHNYRRDDDGSVTYIGPDWNAPDDDLDYGDAPEPEPEPKPEPRITGRDGKSYPKSQPTKEPGEPRHRIDGGPPDLPYDEPPPADVVGGGSVSGSALASTHGGAAVAEPSEALFPRAHLVLAASPLP